MSKMSYLMLFTSATIFLSLLQGSSGALEVYNITGVPGNIVREGSSIPLECHYDGQRTTDFKKLVWAFNGATFWTHYFNPPTDDMSPRLPRGIHIEEHSSGNGKILLQNATLHTNGNFTCTLFSADETRHVSASLVMKVAPLEKPSEVKEEPETSTEAPDTATETESEEGSSSSENSSGTSTSSHSILFETILVISFFAFLSFSVFM
jgi:hypothetical protein